MSDYDNSVSHYAVKLGVSERQVRRYCRGRLVPSAELTTGRTGRPKWRINDTSPRAIRDLREALTFQRFDPPSFCEPIPIQHYEENSEGKLVPTKQVIRWRPVYTAPIRDRYDLITVLSYREALRLHNLTQREITSLPLNRNKRRISVIDPSPHEKKLLAFERTESRLSYGLCKPASSKQHRFTRHRLVRDLRESDIMYAAERLAVFNRTYGIEITYRSLAQVLGMSKSAMYRTYPGLVGKALKLAHKKAASPTQSDEWAKEDYLRDCNSFPTRAPRDLGFADLYNAAFELNAAGKPMDKRNIYLTLRRQGCLAEGEKLSDYFGPIDVANAVRAVTESQGSPAHQKAPPCPAT